MTLEVISSEFGGSRVLVFPREKRWLQGAKDTESYRIRYIQEMGTQERVDEAGIVESCVRLGGGKEA